MSIKAVIWTPEGVWYKGMGSLNYLSGSDRDAARVAQNLCDNEYLRSSDVNGLSGYLRQGVDKFKNVLGIIGLLMAGPYPGSWHNKEEIEAYRAKVIERLAGMGISVSDGVTGGMIKDAVSGLQFTKGASDAIRELKGEDIIQVAASNDLAPFLYQVAAKVGKVDYIEAAPTEVRVGIDRVVFDGSMIDCDYMVIGESRGPYHCMKEALDGLNGRCNDGEVLLIGGIQPDVESMQRVKDSGGIAIGFNPDTNTQGILERRGMPVLRSNVPDLAPIPDIAADPERVEYWCL